MLVWKAKGDGKNMYVLLYLLWILLNGRVTAEILAVGVPVAGLVYGFGYLALGYRLSGDLLLLKRLGHILVFLAMVAWEVVKANVAIIRIVLSHHMEITPCLVPVKTDLKSAGARAALANAITLTPGTRRKAINITYRKTLTNSVLFGCPYGMRIFRNRSFR